jgi:ribosomal protein S18 acetylase RimI-like enzyme
MEITSLLHKTSLLFSEFSSQVFDKGDHILIQTPDNPTFHWGNYLIFQHAPRMGDFARWTELFRRSFPYYDHARHYVFAWQQDSCGEYREFTDNGFKLERSVVLTADSVATPPRYHPEISVKTIVTDEEWEQVICCQISCAAEEYAGPGYEVFKRRQFAQYRRMAEAGIGAWYGAFLNGRIVGDLGIFRVENIGRYQNVGTHPEFRRRGVCQTLVYETARRSLDDGRIKTLVMEADAEYHAARIYESVGFRPTETHYALTWWEGNAAEA